MFVARVSVLLLLLLNFLRVAAMLYHARGAASLVWTAMSVFAAHDSKLVYRSGGMLGYPEEFRYKEVMGFKVRARAISVKWERKLL